MAVGRVYKVKCMKWDMGGQIILRIHVDFTVNIVSRCQNLPILLAADPMQHCVSNLEALILIWKTH